MRRFMLAIVIAGTLFTAAWAHVDGRPSIHDVLASVVHRMSETMDEAALKTLTVETILSALTPEDRAALGTEYWSFRVDVPVTASVMRDTKQTELPFWLEEQGFKKSTDTVEVGARIFEVWQKDFDAGIVGFGINGFERHNDHYFIGLAPQKRRDKVTVTEMYPGRHRVTDMKADVAVYMDDLGAKLTAIPAKLDGQVLVRAVKSRSQETALVGMIRFTPYPATAAPDQIVLTWSEDPKTTQTVQWRTNTSIENGLVRFKPGSGGDVTEVEAVMTKITDTMLMNDSVNHRFTAVMKGLKPSTEYAYAVGTGAEDSWTEWATFTTAPAETVPFKFIYMGDAQNGLDTWGNLLRKAHADEPDAAFYVMAGDLVNRGVQRDDWDSFFHNATGVYNHKQLVPAIGNHEDQGGELGPWMYLEMFDLPKNGPAEIQAEKAYSFEYSNALFVVLDTNDSVPNQVEWLEEQLAGSDATWKFVVYHHPAYSSGPRRDNPLVRRLWGAIFDKYHVDLALQGHDHAYLRTYPMKAEQRVDSAAEGTIYIVSVSGTKFYEQPDHDYTEFGMTNVSTYQTLDIVIDGNRLTYKAYDIEGKVRDEFVIEK